MALLVSTSTLRRPYIVLYVVFSLVSYNLSIPLTTAKTDAKINANEKSDEEKKGTIRIAGPWHSDSALDRNVDPGEDSYVKKIISSNEGINFNKDIAEAGEMFDVNGIEDFYDKNAMITYEINGHEIPVHMHPKLTPQSKSLFPEYMKDSPASMGLVRGSTSKSKLGTDTRKNTGAKLFSTFTGMSMSDMPEYKTSADTKLANLNSGRQLLNTMQSYANQQYKAGDSVENTARVFKSTGVNINDNTNSKVSTEGYGQMSNKNLRYFHNNIPPNGIHQHLGDENDPIPANAVNDRNDFVDQRVDARLNQNPQQFEEQAKESDKTGLKYDVPDGQSSSVVKANDFSEHENSEKKGTEDVLFEKLESLHRNLEKDKLENEAAMKSVSDDNDEPKKTKAKERILNLLGTLTDKLKGMESIVSGNQDKKVEKFVSEKEEPLVAHMTQVNEVPVNQDNSDNIEQEEATNQAEIQKQQGRYSSHETVTEPSVKETASFAEDNSENPEHDRIDDTAELGHLAQYDDDKYSLRAEQSASERDSQDDGKSMLLKTFRRIGGTSSSLPLSHDNSLEESKHENEIITQFHDHNKPFVMNINTLPLSHHNRLEESKHENEIITQFHDRNKPFVMNTNALPLSHHNRLEESKHENEIITQFHDHNKPFIMNTNAIDFKPSPQSETIDEYSEVAKVDADGEEEVETPVSHFYGKNHHNTRRFHDKDDSVDDDDDDENESSQHHATLLPSMKRKHTLDDEDLLSRQMLLHFRKHRHNINNVDDENDGNWNRKIKSENNDDDDDDSEENDQDDNNNDKNMRHRSRHLHRHRYHNEDDEKISTTKKHHHLHQPTVESDDSVDEEDPKRESVDTSRKTLTTKQKQHSSEHQSFDRDIDGEENAKMYAVEEDLASADEKRGRSLRPTVSEDVDFPDYNDVKDAAIFETNLLRKKFHAKPVHWSDKLSDRAQVQAEILSKLTDLNDKSLISRRVPGEDVAMIGINSTNVGKDAPDLWVRGSKFYDFRSPQITNKNTDFAQMMWKASNEFGLGVAKSKTGNNWIVTSMFDTPVVDRFKDLKMNLESDIPIEDPYSDIVG